MIVIVLYKDRLEKLETVFNNLFIFSPKENNTNLKSDDDSSNLKQTMPHSPSQLENENILLGETSSSDHVTEIQFNSLNDPPQPTSIFDDGYCIYQTPNTPSRINDFTLNSGTFSAMAQDGRNLPSGNQHPYPFGYLPVLVPGIVRYSPCWLPSWGGWIASWVSWISPDSPPWTWPSFLWTWSSSHSRLHDKILDSGRYLSTGEPHIPTATADRRKPADFFFFWVQKAPWHIRMFYSSCVFLFFLQIVYSVKMSIEIPSWPLYYTIFILLLTASGYSTYPKSYSGWLGVCKY